MASGDELLVIRDDAAKWGNSSRDRAMSVATATHMLFMDDDDVYAEGAIAVARLHVSEWPEHVHVFRMESAGDNDPWHSHEIRPGNLATPMLIWPRIGAYPNWADDDTGVSDFRFIDKAVRGRQLMWHEEVLAIVRP
jgi:hypothetical protein